MSKKLRIYYRGGDISHYERMQIITVDDEEDEKLQLTKMRKIEGYKFKLLPSIAIDGGRIYECINEDMHICDECEGRGHNECRECEGTGEIECDFCEGQGSMDVKADKEELKKKELLKQQEEEFKKRQLPLEL